MASEKNDIAVIPGAGFVIIRSEVITLESYLEVPLRCCTGLAYDLNHRKFLPL